MRASVFVCVCVCVCEILNALNNCYGEYVYNLTRLSCYESTCYTQFTTRTKCRTLTLDGQAFNNCSYADAADRVLDMGANIAYPGRS